MTTLGHLIHQDLKRPWSFADITRQLQGRVKNLKMVFVDQEHQKNWSLDSVFGKTHNAAAILLTVRVPGTRKQQRHWVCLLKLKGNRIQFFDSLALSYAELNSMLWDDGKFTEFLKKIRASPSTKRLQEDITHVRNCGAWVCVRAAFGISKNLTNHAFYHFILSEKNTKPDITCMKLVAIGMLT